MPAFRELASDDAEKARGNEDDDGVRARRVRVSAGATRQPKIGE